MRFMQAAATACAGSALAVAGLAAETAWFPRAAGATETPAPFTPPRP